jgi:phage-related protein (TIGR01555 family)
MSKDSLTDRVKKRADNIIPSFRRKSITGGFGDGPGIGIEDADQGTGTFDEITNEQLEIAYIRNPIAFKAINKLSRDPWDKFFRYDAGNESWEDVAMQLLKDIDFKESVMEQTKYAFIHGSAGLALDLEETVEKSPEEPVEPGQVQGINGLNVIKETMVTDYVIDQDPTSSTYGEIEFYVVDRSDEDNEVDEVRIHRSRFIHFRSFAVTDDPAGFGLLHPVYNSLQVFDNVLYGAGQSFFFAGTGFPTVKTKGLDSGEQDDFADEFGQNVMEKPYIVLDEEQFDLEFKGAQGKVLDPTNYFEPLFQILASALGGSKQVLFGNEAGEITGSEINQEEYFGDISSFQSDKLEPLVTEFTDRMISYGLLESPDSGYVVEWSDLFEKSEEKQAEIINNRSKAFARFAKSGMTLNQALEKAGLEELEEGGDQTMQNGGGEGNPEDVSDPEENADKDGDSKDSVFDVGENVSLEVEADAVLAESIGFDRSKTVSDEQKRESREFLVEQIGGSDGLRKDYFSLDYDLSEPTNWSQEQYQAYTSVREKLKGNVYNLCQDIADLVDEATLGSDEAGNDEEAGFNREKFKRRVNERLDSFEEEQPRQAQDKLKGAYRAGMGVAGGQLNITPPEVFDKHREKVLESAVDKWTRPAYANTRDAVEKRIDQQIRDYYDNQDMGLPELKRNIEGVADKEAYRAERIARTETGRLSNIGFVDEASRRGVNLYDWVGPSDESTTETCRDIKAGNPYSREGLAQVTDGFLPHIQCRHSPAVSRDGLKG